MLKLQFKDRRRESVWLVDAKFSIGKARSNSLMIEDPSVDDIHAEIINTLDQQTLIKKTAKGALKLNGQDVTQNTPIKENDIITIGQVELELVDSQSLVANRLKQTNTAHIWSLHSSASWLDKSDFIINKKTTIGRDSTCDICLSLDYLSRQHVSLEPHNGKLFIEDLNSSNGTYVNGEKITKVELKPGDKIKLDVLTFEVRGPSDVSASDPNKTIIRTAPVAKVNVESPAKAEPKTSVRLSSTPPLDGAPSKQPTHATKHAQTRRKRLASEGKQAWISGDNQLKTKAEKKKGNGGLLFVIFSLAIAAAGLTFILLQ